MLIGYARTSTLDQAAGFAAQVRDLEATGCTKTFSEQVSATGPRPQLEAALDYLRDGDTLVVCKLDRLARSVAHLGQILEIITAKGAALRILDLNVDTSSATGALVLNLLGAVAQFERTLMLERQKEGIAAAKSAGKYKGRAPTARAKAIDVARLRAEGIGPAEIARRLKISRASVYRILGNAADHGR